MSDKQHKVFLLPKDRRYLVFQLYATNANKKISADDALKISVLMLMQWLRTKIDDQNIPPEIDYPDSQDYQDFDMAKFKPFRADLASMQAVYLPTEKIFSFQMTDDVIPDKSNDFAEGRKYISNIGMRINGDVVEYGFKVFVSEPNSNNYRAKYFRMAFIRDLINSPLIGLQLHYKIQPSYIELKSDREIEGLSNYLSNEHAHLPAIIVSQYETTVTDKTDIATEEIYGKMLEQHTLPGRFPGNFKTTISFPSDGRMQNPRITMKTSQIVFKETDARKNTSKQVRKNGVTAHKKEDRTFEYACDIQKIQHLSEDFMAFAHFFVLPFDKTKTFNKKLCQKLSPGQVLVLPAKSISQSPKIFKKEDVADDSKSIKFETYIYDFLRTELIDYGGVKFLSEALVLQQENILKERHSNDAEKNDIIDKYEKQITLIQNNHNEKFRELEARNCSVDKKLKETEYHNKMLKHKNKELSEQNGILERQIKSEQEKYQKIVKYFHKRRLWPKSADKIADWVASNFKDRLILHDSAKKLLKTKNINSERIELMCEGLEYLSDLYYNYYFFKEDLDGIQKISADRYNRVYVVTPINDHTIATFPGQYKVLYKTADKSISDKRDLDIHLKCGVDSQFLVRIYFFFDNERRLIVVGSLPEHLPTDTMKSN